jgi:hypothetical protein
MGENFLANFCLPIQGRRRQGEKSINFGQFWTPISGFCYIVVSTFFGPSGPPPDPPKSDIFGPPFWEKYSLFVGNDIVIGPFLGVDFGVEKWGSFCRKVQNFKKFMKWTPPDPPGQIWSILMIFDPPMACQFWPLFEQFLRGHFWTKFWRFLTLHFINL